ncbi:MAG: succinyl-CoA synthetase beta subunit, partial [Methylophilaceae bacterium]
MNLHEYQSKELLKANGINIPKSQISNSVDETFSIAQKFNSSLAVKAQIHAGGRGKAGGIKIVQTPQEAKEFASIIIGKNLITEQNKPHGQPVNKLLIEQTISIKKEMYFSILIDRQLESIVVITSRSGGMDIEEIANKKPNS